MAVKKKTNSLRGKAATRAVSSAAKAQNAEATGITELKDLNPFLHQLKQTKRDKMLTKATEFIGKLKSGNTSGQISKSSLRRQKRKVKEQLKPKMEDLLTSLPLNLLETAETTRIVAAPTAQFVNKLVKNKPSIMKKKGSLKIIQEETIKFHSVLSDKSFRANPMDAMRQSLLAQQQQK
ncbi:hypothetical protein BABINDRAFT_41682 [Babjeviella inositovora NRRL Y-12698]|uniref:Ribosome biogenesis protein SLX9 n=1 Tax=Babjeviella inositovora NRRL Y-12698 TaxID=984486 RepID=A0A1E3QI88_9ASCO|nr:uncharacterized protein BABINDRAFT_41682 [Babjeviella inositovora NRRL Y-12698]ODQ77318.1 hypothetical protein BABINDRAFT_41682 [Babjeviella inositovora NRRL Y-12698]